MTAAGSRLSGVARRADTKSIGTHHFRVPAIPPYWLEYHCPRRTLSGRPIPQRVVGYWQEALATTA